MGADNARPEESRSAPLSNLHCDETSPQCQRCVKRQITCSFLDEGPERLSTPSGNILVFDRRITKTLDYPPLPGLDSDPDQLPHGSTPISRPQSGVVAGEEGSLGGKQFDLLDLELIQHYSTRTYMTMSSRLSTHVVWRDTIFAEALRHDFLLHGLMATSALHKATMQPKTSDAYAEYSKVALAHQNAALAGYIPAVSKPTQDNGIALFSVSLLLTVWAFASKRLPEGLNSVKLEFDQGDGSPGITLPLHSPTADFIEIIMILRGIHAVIRETDSWLQGDIEELLRYPRDADLPPHSADVVEAFEVLARAIDDPHLTPLLEHEGSNSTKSLCLEQLERLRTISRCRSVVEWDGHIFSWLIMAPLPFIHCLKQGNPMALALFAHWAAIFQCMDHHWWATGWAYSLVAEVSSLLDPIWGPYLDWPRKQVGLAFQEGATFDGHR
ncbi:hypothetical protein A1O1_03444 [Capronia coronata CBS 617.96]|uniref:Zn(2)-C6 fungal-type domain-containing protein n=1 Tax=Capronia coronata CBS 617.96 TaxID=1182541 RepID=W9YL22_9EURO|nr:uncharacterized protein A1O1_03444 [Capronia coronata CBS 617.96]EXJ90345.1 hypothetical protein A1O1_03444 [Capronia coronata CBS 617.96]